MSAVITTFTFGARPIGALIAASITAGYGPAACVIAALVGFAIQLAIILLSTVSKLAEIPEAESTWSAPVQL